MKVKTRFHLLAALAFAATLGSGCKTASTPSAGSAPPHAPVQAGPQRGAPRLVCPPLDSILVPAPQSKDGHRVILKWKASRRADAKHADAIGYCIYRGPKPNAPPTELINRLPFPETTCVDDSVENGKNYYYVVRAISARGVTSDISKPHVPAKIPNTPRITPLPPDDSTPLCREPPGAK